MIKRQTLIPLGVLSNAAWLGFLALAVFFVAVSAVTIVRNHRRPDGSRS